MQLKCHSNFTKRSTNVIIENTQVSIGQNGFLYTLYKRNTESVLSNAPILSLANCVDDTREKIDCIHYFAVPIPMEKKCNSFSSSELIN